MLTLLSPTTPEDNDLTFLVSSGVVGDNSVSIEFSSNRNTDKQVNSYSFSTLATEFGVALSYNYPKTEKGQSVEGLSTTTPEHYDRNAGAFDLLYTASDARPAVLSAKVEFGTNNTANSIRIVKGSEAVVLSDNGVYVDLPAISPNEKYTLLYTTANLGKDLSIMERANDFTIRIKNASGVEKVITQPFMLRRSIPRVEVVGSNAMRIKESNNLEVRISDPNPALDVSSFTWSAKTNKDVNMTMPSDVGGGLPRRFTYGNALEDGVHRVTVTAKRTYDGLVKDSFLDIRIDNPNYNILSVSWIGSPYYTFDTAKYVEFHIAPEMLNTPQTYRVAFSTMVGTPPSDFFTLSSPKTREAIDLPYTPNMQEFPTYIWDTNIIQRVPRTNRYRVRIDFKDKGFTKKDFTIYVKNNYGVTRELTEALSIDDRPVTFTTSLDDSRIDGIYQVVNGFVGVPVEVTLQNTSTYTEGSYTWSIDDGNENIASLKNIAGSTIGLVSATRNVL